MQPVTGRLGTMDACAGKVNDVARPNFDLDLSTHVQQIIAVSKRVGNIYDAERYIIGLI